MSHFIFLSQSSQWRSVRFCRVEVCHKFHHLNFSHLLPDTASTISSQPAAETGNIMLSVLRFSTANTC